MFEQSTEISKKELLWELPQELEGKTVCLRCSGGFGDALMSLGSVSRYLSEKGAKVIAATLPKYISTVQALADVHTVVESQTTNRDSFQNSVDAIVDLTCFAIDNSRELHGGDYYLAAFEEAGIHLSSQAVGNYLPEFDYAELVAPAAPLNKVALHSGSTSPLRTWPDSRWEELAKSLLSLGYHVVWLGTEDDFSMIGENQTQLYLTRPGFKSQVEYLNQCDFFVGNDSGFIHAAGILGVPGVGLFSITSPDTFIPRYKSLRGLTKNPNPSRTTRNDDPEGYKLLCDITPTEVIVELARLGVGCVGRPKKFNSLLDSPVRVDFSGLSNYEELSDYFLTRKHPETVDVKISDMELTGDTYDDVKLIRSEVGKKFPDSIRKGTIKVVRKYGLGDFIMGTACLVKLHDMFPEAEIKYASKPDYLTLIPDDLPWLSTCEIDDPDYTHSVILDYYGFWLTDLHAVEALGGSIPDIMNLKVDTGNMPYIEPRSVSIWPVQGENPNKIKEWGESNWIKLIDELTQKGVTVYQLGGTTDRLVDHPSLQDLRFNSINDLAASVLVSKNLVTIEGACQHIAKALGKKAIVIWGNSSTVESVGYDSHTNLRQYSTNSCWASFDVSSFKELNCCGGGCAERVSTSKVLEHLKSEKSLLL